jgi:hypothetical protein
VQYALLKIICADIKKIINQFDSKVSVFAIKLAQPSFQYIITRVYVHVITLVKSVGLTSRN